MLIDATLRSIEEIGLIRTSVSEIITRAGLSRGMIHLHFKGKDNLIVETARQANMRYYETLNRHIGDAGTDPGQVIDAAVRSDLSPEALNIRTASIWYELRGAARTNARIAEFSDTREKRLRDLLQSSILKLCEQGNLPDAEQASRDVTSGLIALMEGMWTDFLLHPTEFNRARAARVVFRFLSGVLPQGFTTEGAARTLR